MNNEYTKTSLLIIASILTAAGAAMMESNIVAGCVLLGLAVVVLIVRGVLKAKGIEIEANNETK